MLAEAVRAGEADVAAETARPVPSDGGVAARLGMHVMTRGVSQLSLLSASHAATDFYQGSIAVFILPGVRLPGSVFPVPPGSCLPPRPGHPSPSRSSVSLLTDVRRSGLSLPSWWPAGVGIGMIGVVGHYWWAMSTALLSCLGVAAYHPVAARLARRVGGGGAQVMSWFIVGGNMGLMLAPLAIAPLLIAFGLAVTLLLALLGVAMALIVALSGQWPLAPSASRMRRPDARSQGRLAVIQLTCRRGDHPLEHLLRHDVIHRSVRHR